MNPLEVRDAIERVVAGVATLPAERATLHAARGRVLAESIRSAVAIPPWANSAMDGYAVRAADLAAVPVRLTVTETVAAGGFPSRAVGPREATRIMTGAPIPDGADSVVRVEDTDGGLDTVEIRDARDAGKNIRPRGEDLAEGAEALPAGSAIHAAQMGLLASIGAREVNVIRRPVVAVLTSGDELVPPERFEEAAAGRKIVSSNSVTLVELVREAGGEPRDLGIAADTPESIREHLARAAGADLVITSGGISVGEFDHMRPVLSAMGARLDFWRVRMRPGAPIGFGRIGDQPWIGLPGNPVSTMVTFELFARPAIRRMMGHAACHRATIPVVLDAPVTVQADLTHFLRVVLARRPDGQMGAQLTGGQSSGMLSSMARASALLVLPRGTLHADAGTELRAIPLGPDAAYTDTLAR